MGKEKAIKLLESYGFEKKYEKDLYEFESEVIRINVGLGEKITFEAWACDAYIDSSDWLYTDEYKTKVQPKDIKELESWLKLLTSFYHTETRSNRG